jgi:hypothetical protein
MIGQRMRAVPRDGAHVRDPRTNEQIPPDGKVVLVDVFWARRLIAGEVDLLPLAKSQEKRIDIQTEAVLLPEVFAVKADAGDSAPADEAGEPEQPITRSHRRRKESAND